MYLQIMTHAQLAPETDHILCSQTSPRLDIPTSQGSSSRRSHNDRYAALEFWHDWPFRGDLGERGRVQHGTASILRMDCLGEEV